MEAIEDAVAGIHKKLSKERLRVETVTVRGSGPRTVTQRQLKRRR
jgi:hypothetical protein